MAEDLVWHGVKMGDPATWAGAAMTFFAAAIALWLGLRDGYRRAADRRRDADTLLAFLEPELRAIFEALGRLKEIAEKIISQEFGLALNQLEAMNELAHKNLSAPQVHGHFDKFSMLPGDLGTRLSAVLGSLRPIMARTQWIQTNIRSTKPADYSKELGPYIHSIDVARTHLSHVMHYAKHRGVPH